MAFEPFIQFVRGLQGKVNTSGMGGNQGLSFQQIAFLRQIHRDLHQEDKLTVPLEELGVVVFDIETTGFYPEQGDEIISLGAVKMKGGIIRENDIFYSLVFCNNKIPESIQNLTGISGVDLQNAPPLSDVLVRFFEFAKGNPLVAHHANHEKAFMQAASWKQFRTPFKHRVIDTSFLYRLVEPNLQLTRLEDLCEYHDIPVTNRHHALGDAVLTAKLWSIYIQKIQQLGCCTLRDVYNRLANL
ncbi:exonuclease domain-containing protein [Bacillus sinesaloumensis]|uniref:exonuclease domain-containing protein n=1 Tax=Litchfieldia sinesaloumensis TaxID=1926280 RepID=UPI0009885574|nr:exonuclease domain-containing protein [Bacillus sinesaloumensis]